MTFATLDLRTRRNGTDTQRHTYEILSFGADIAAKDTTISQIWKSKWLIFPFLSSYFSLKRIIFRHERTHTGERPLKCSRCDATFVDKLTLERHLIRDHSKVKPHICHICGKGFYLPFDLKIHLDRHDGKHLIKCDTCGDTFIDPNTLQAHRVKLHGEDPVVCDEW